MERGRNGLPPYIPMTTKTWEISAFMGHLRFSSKVLPNMPCRDIQAMYLYHPAGKNGRAYARRNQTDRWLISNTEPPEKCTRRTTINLATKKEKNTFHVFLNTLPTSVKEGDIFK